MASEFRETPWPDWYVDFKICERMGWTYADLDATPLHRIREIGAVLELEARRDAYHDE